ncbi:MAG TPA: hypothetical protein VNL96_04920 [Gemmatimonadaceae bacterium]|nr:hypothetical protein [Gemmatimonadaceae bacterium]
MSVQIGKRLADDPKELLSCYAVELDGLADLVFAYSGCGTNRVQLQVGRTLITAENGVKAVSRSMDDPVLLAARFKMGY